MSEPTNPANAPAMPTAPAVRADRKRIPMSIPRRKLEVPDIVGYHLHWFLDANVPRALQGGYVMVDESEVPINQFNVGTDSSLSGNADMGSHIKIIAGTAENGSPTHLNLMKIKEEWWQEDQRLIEKQNASILSAIFTQETIPGAENERPDDRNQRYVKTAVLNRPTRKANK